jgi:hypothetical protein
VGEGVLGRMTPRRARRLVEERVREAVVVDEHHLGGVHAQGFLMRLTLRGARRTPVREGGGGGTAREAKVLAGDLDILPVCAQGESTRHTQVPCGTCGAVGRAPPLARCVGDEDGV